MHVTCFTKSNENASMASHRFVGTWKQTGHRRRAEGVGGEAEGRSMNLSRMGFAKSWRRPHRQSHRTLGSVNAPNGRAVQQRILLFNGPPRSPSLRTLLADGFSPSLGLLVSADSARNVPRRCSSHALRKYIAGNAP
jgi:hypothetical protein